MEFESYVANEETRALAVCVQLSGEIGRNVSVILSSTDLSAQGKGICSFTVYRVVKMFMH